VCTFSKAIPCFISAVVTRAGRFGRMVVDEDSGDV
jgi:hypothetical protein